MNSIGTPFNSYEEELKQLSPHTLTCHKTTFNHLLKEQSLENYNNGCFEKHFLWCFADFFLTLRSHILLSQIFSCSNDLVV